MVATPSVQPSTPALDVSLATLCAVLAKGQAAHPELACRMQRAAEIVALRSVAPAMAPENVGHAYWVESQDGSCEYWVCLSERGYRGDRCTCPDYQQRGGPCKHAIAVRLLQKCEAVERERGPEPPPTPIAFPQRVYADDDRVTLTPAGRAYLAALDAAPVA
ncbi:MAG TPA: SWIM zinc finger family protein [Chloroflexota bacterium]|nr:SWIM zinc finger family protein [Chloroflexota bacterium]